MIDLIFQISGYLLVSFVVGGGAGWLWRHREAADEVTDAHRSVEVLRTRTPLLEGTLKDRDHEIAALREQLQQLLATLQKHRRSRDELKKRLRRLQGEMRQFEHLRGAGVNPGVVKKLQRGLREGRDKEEAQQVEIGALKAQLATYRLRHTHRMHPAAKPEVSRRQLLELLADEIDRSDLEMHLQQNDEQADASDDLRAFHNLLSRSGAIVEPSSDNPSRV